MVIWALVSRGSSETVELYLDERSARMDLREAIRDEPEWEDLLEVVPLDWSWGSATASLN